ncbi:MULTISPECIES: MotE family protein [Alphaproteobacteria]|uniref:MotE family protein n=1 Tax=Alphaproteobacteria TaxID=28211 RepID=UPI003A8EA6E0
MSTEKHKKKAAPKMKKRSLKAGRGALFVLSVVLFMSAVVRVFSGTGAAIAKEVAHLTKEEMYVEAPVDPIACMADEELDSLITALRKREKTVEEKEREIEEKLAVVDVARAEIEESFKALEVAEARLAATMAISNSAAEDDLARLTSVYESMKPKDSAALFQAMDPDFAAGFLGRMRADAAAEIMAGLPPEFAYSVSVILAGRNANAPSE